MELVGKDKLAQLTRENIHTVSPAPNWSLSTHGTFRRSPLSQMHFCRCRKKVKHDTFLAINSFDFMEIIHSSIEVGLKWNTQ